MPDPELLKILCCPETRQPLRVADGQFVATLNQRIVTGALRTRSGGAITEACEGALLRQDGKVAYPIRHGLPILLISEGIELGAPA